MTPFLRTAMTAGLVFATCLAAQSHAQAEVYDQCAQSRHPSTWGYKKCLRYSEVRYEICRSAGRPRLRCIRERGAAVASCRRTWCTIRAHVRRQ